MVSQITSEELLKNLNRLAKEIEQKQALKMTYILEIDTRTKSLFLKCIHFSSLYQRFEQFNLAMVVWFLA